MSTTMKSDSFFSLFCLLSWCCAYNGFFQRQTRQRHLKVSDYRDGWMKLICVLMRAVSVYRLPLPALLTLCATIQPLGLVEWLVSPAVLEMHSYPPTACFQNQTIHKVGKMSQALPKHKLGAVSGLIALWILLGIIIDFLVAFDSK